MSTRQLFAKDALLPTGWAQNIHLTWNDEGVIESVFTGVDAKAINTLSVPHAKGPLLPGMPNLHSHAFQRGFAGLTEFKNQSQDSFWSWRTQMYQFALQISPAQMLAIAKFLYIEMLQAGYTSVCEFHYLHHDTDGKAYANAATMAQCLLQAAQETGIHITLLPVLYQHSGFDGQAPLKEQKRFLHSNKAMQKLLEQLNPICQAQDAVLGLAPHSLRAVTLESLKEALDGLHSLNAAAPIHIHIAEQMAEVNACLAWSGKRPVELLLHHFELNSKWCLVHATHLSPSEIKQLATSQAVAGICPSTECNLGDGIFNMPAWLEHDGVWGIGSDSHVCVNAAEELMLLEYSQRLHLQQRNVIKNQQQPDVASAMMLAAVKGGAQASGRNIKGLAVGQSADFVVLDAEHFATACLPQAPQQLASHIFASHRSNAIESVWVKGHRLVHNGQHSFAQNAKEQFIQVRQTLC